MRRHEMVVARRDGLLEVRPEGAVVKTDILDHGYVELVESWGSDERIIESARMSTAKGFQGWGPLGCEECVGSGLVTRTMQQGWLGGGIGEPRVTELKCGRCGGSGFVPGDDKLLRFLWNNKHHTPFEMGGLTLEVQAPIFVFREWHRHRTQSYNELSARYTALPDLFYVPSVDRVMAGRQSAANKQGSESGFTIEEAEDYRHRIGEVYAKARETYEQLLRYGVAREIARVVIPVAQYSRMRASANLRNWLAFLTLRMAPTAQWEIRQFANAVGEMVALVFPRTWELFSDTEGSR